MGQFIKDGEWSNIHTRLDNIEKLLIANSKHDVNGAPMKPTTPSAYDILKTTQMLFRESTSFEMNVHTRDTGSFRYDGYVYRLTVEREEIK